MAVDGITKITMSGANATKEAMLRTPESVASKTRTFWGTDSDTTVTDPLRFDNKNTFGWDTPTQVDNAEAVSAGQSGVAWTGSLVPGRRFNIPFLRKPGQNRDPYDDLYWSGLVNPLVVTFYHATNARYLLSCKPESSPGTKDRWSNKNQYRLESAWPWYVEEPYTETNNAGTVSLQPPYVLYFIDMAGASKGGTVQFQFAVGPVGDVNTYTFSIKSPDTSYIICPAKPFLLNMHNISGVEPPPYLQPGQSFNLTKRSGTGTPTLRIFRNYNSPPGVSV